MNILIIGANGFIGKAAVEYFMQLGWQVSICTSSQTIMDRYADCQVHCISPNEADFNAVFQASTFDFCLNAAGAAVVSRSLTDTYSDYRLNTLNVLKILEAIRHHNPNCKLIQLSSAAVYGNPAAIPTSELSPSKPLSPYGWHKYQAELLCQEYFQIFGVKSIALRIFSAYGRGLNKQLFWDIYQRSKNQTFVSLFGTGNESRDFIHIKDLLKVIHLVATKADFQAQVINVANGQEITIKEAVKAFFESFNPEINYQFSGQVKQGDPTNWCADITVLKNLGYSQSVSFQEGIKDYTKWLQAEIE